MGNLLSVRRAFEYIGASVEITSSQITVEKADYLVLPGVGAFRDGMSELFARGLVEPIRTFVSSGRPFLGICLGMQMMLDSSGEFGRHEGLGLIPGKVERIPEIGKNGVRHKVPHVGWAPLIRRSISASWTGTILKQIEPGESAYFVHSYTAVPSDTDNRLADIDYDGCSLSAVIHFGRLYGCQFHPEKSGPTGLKILSEFTLLEL